MKLFDNDKKKGSISLKLFLLTFLLLWVISPMSRPSNDARIYWDTAYNMAVQGTPSLGYNAQGYVVRNSSGQYYPKYGIGWPLALVPAAGLYRIVDIQELDMGVKEVYEQLIFTLTPAAAGAGIVVLIFSLLVMLGLGRRWAVIFALTTVFSTPLLVYGRSLYSESFQAFLLTLFLWSCVALEQKKRLFYAMIMGIAVGWAMLAKITNGALLLAGLAWILWMYRGKGPWRPVFTLLLAVLPFGAILIWYNLISFESILPLSYGFYLVPQGFFTPLYYGLFGDILSPGKGLLWYMPMIFLLPWGVKFLWHNQKRRYVVLIFGIFLFFLILYAKWSPWHGAEQWGPRFLVPFIGLLMVLIAFSIQKIIHKKLVIGVLIAAGMMINILGVVILHSDYYAQLPYTPYSSIHLGPDGKPKRQLPLDNLYLPAFVPAFSPIVGHFWLLKHAFTGNPQLSDDPPWKWLGYKPFNKRIKNYNVQPNLWFCINRTTFGHVLSLVMALFFILLALASGWEIRQALNQGP